MRIRHCPDCGSLWVRSSRRRGLYEWLLGLFLLKPLRCQDCNRRYYDLFWAVRSGKG